MNDISLFGVFVGMAVIAYILYTQKLDMQDYEALYCAQEPAPTFNTQPPIIKRRKVRDESDTPLPGHEGLFGQLKKVQGAPIRVIRESPTVSSILMKDQAISTDETEIKEGALTTKRLREREEDKPTTDLKRKQAISSTISNVKRQAMFYNIDAFKNRREKFYEALSKIQVNPAKPRASNALGTNNEQSPAKTITHSNLYVSPSEQTSVIINPPPTVKKTLFTGSEGKKEPDTSMTPNFSKSDEIKDQTMPSVSKFKPDEHKAVFTSSSIFGAQIDAKPETSTPKSASLFSNQPQSIFVSGGKTEVVSSDKTSVSSSMFNKTETKPTIGFGGNTVPASQTSTSLYEGNSENSIFPQKLESSSVSSGNLGTTNSGLFGNTGGLYGNVASPATIPADKTKENAPQSSLFGTQTNTGATLGLQTSAPSPSGALFGQTSSASPTDGLLGQQDTTPTSSFGAQPSNTKSTPGFGQTANSLPLFGQSALSTSSSMFGVSNPTSPVQQDTTPTSSFGAQTSNTKSAPGFGQTANSLPLFGQSIQSTSPSMLGASNPTSPAPGSLFGSTPSWNTQPVSLFGGASQSTQAVSMFGGQSSQPSSLFESSSFGTGQGIQSGVIFGHKSNSPNSAVGFTSQSTNQAIQGGLGSFGGFGSGVKTNPPQKGTVTNPLFAKPS